MIKLESKNPSGTCHVIFPKDCICTLKEKLVPHADLIIADPPYYKVVGEKWDYQWRTEQDYIDWSVQWLSAAYV